LDDAVIRPGENVVTVDADASVNSVSFGNTSNTAGSISVNVGVTLTITTDLTFRNAAGTSTVASLTGAGTIDVLALFLLETQFPDSEQNSDSNLEHCRT